MLLFRHFCHKRAFFLSGGGPTVLQFFRVQVRTYVLTCLVGAIVNDRGGPGREMSVVGDAEKKSADAQVETNLCGAGDFGFLGGCLNA